MASSKVIYQSLKCISKSLFQFALNCLQAPLIYHECQSGTNANLQTVYIPPHINIVQY